MSEESLGARLQALEDRYSSEMKRMHEKLCAAEALRPESLNEAQATIDHFRDLYVREQRDHKRTQMQLREMSAKFKVFRESSIACEKALIELRRAFRFDARFEFSGEKLK